MIPGRRQGRNWRDALRWDIATGWQQWVWEERKGTRTQDVQEARLPERERTEADGNKLVVQVPIGTGKTKTTELARLRKTYWSHLEGTHCQRKNRLYSFKQKGRSQGDLGTDSNFSYYQDSWEIVQRETASRWSTEEFLLWTNWMNDKGSTFFFFKLPIALTWLKWWFSLPYHKPPKNPPPSVLNNEAKSQ